MKRISIIIILSVWAMKFLYFIGCLPSRSVVNDATNTNFFKAYDKNILIIENRCSVSSSGCYFHVVLIGGFVLVFETYSCPSNLAESFNIRALDDHRNRYKVISVGTLEYNDYVYINKQIRILSVTGDTLFIGRKGVYLHNCEYSLITYNDSGCAKRIHFVNPDEEAKELHKIRQVINKYISRIGFDL